MVLAFLLGLVAAVAAAWVEPHLRGALDRVLPDLRLTAMELRLAAFAACLVAAALVSALIGSGGGVALTLGALAGVFLPRLFGG